MTTPQIPAELTFAQALESARRLAPRIREEAPETEARSHHSEGLHEAFLEAGFYHLLRPRTFGGYEFTLGEFLAVMREVARADMSTAWCLTLASGHNLQVAAFWPEEAQRQLFAGTYFASPMTSAPAGKLTRVPGGFRVEGTHRYASGIPFSTHFAGHAMHDDRPGVSAFIAPRDAFTVEADWGNTLGLRGSGSHSVTFDGAVIPAEFVLEGVAQTTIDVSNGTPGLALHGNKMYGASAIGFFAAELSSLAIGGAEAAFDEFEALMDQKRLTLPPFPLRVDDTHFQTRYGRARTRLDAAGALATWATDFFQERIENDPYLRPLDDFRMFNAGQEAGELAWAAVAEELFPVIGSSSVVSGTRLERIWRDLSQWRSHALSAVREPSLARYARGRFGVGEFAPVG